MTSPTTGPGRTGEVRSRTSPSGLKVLLVADPASPHTLRWARGLANEGHRVAVAGFRPSEEGDFEVRRPFPDARSQFSWPGLLRLRRLDRELRRLFAETGPDIVHIHQIPVHAGAGWLYRHLPNLVVTVWGSDVCWDEPRPEPRRVALYKRWLLGRARAVTAASRYLARRTAPYLPGGEVTVVPFGIEVDRFRVKTVRREGPLVIGFLKHLESRYGADVLLRSAALLPDVRVELAGSGGGEGDLRRLRAELGLEDRVTFRGRVPYRDVPDFLESCDVLVMPSRRESFGVAALEAAAAGLPVVASDVGGVGEVVVAGETGYLVPPEKPQALARAVRRLLDPSLRARMGRAGRERAEACFRIEDCVRRMSEVYRGVLEKS